MALRLPRLTLVIRNLVFLVVVLTIGNTLLKLVFSPGPARRSHISTKNAIEICNESSRAREILTASRRKSSWIDNLSLSSDECGVVDNLTLHPPSKFNPFPDRYNSPILDTDGKLLFCWMPKLASSQIKGFMCRRYAEKEKSHKNSPVLAQIVDGLSYFKRYIIHNPVQYCQRIFQSGFGKHTKKQQMATLEDASVEKWAIIRDPLDRIVSGWTNLCSSGARKQETLRRCHGCPAGEFGCFVLRNAVWMRNAANADMPQDQLLAGDHFYPQYWYCDFQNHSHHYDRLFYMNDKSKLRSDIRRSLLEVGMPNSLVTTGWGVKKDEPFLDSDQVPHSDSTDDRHNAVRLLQTSIKHLDAVFQTYFVDYLMFNFKLHPWVRDLCAKSTETQSSKDDGAYDNSNMTNKSAGLKDNFKSSNYIVCRWYSKLKK